jgi:hypothetical protein
MKKGWCVMRNRITSLIVSLALIVVFTPQAYALPDYSVYYLVRYSCICGPEPACYGATVGEWTQHCDGSWSGWGWRPYQNECAYWVESEIIEECQHW